MSFSTHCLLTYTWGPSCIWGPFVFFGALINPSDFEEFLAFTRCARFYRICLPLDAVLAVTALACFHTLCSPFQDWLAFTRCARWHTPCLLSDAVLAFAGRPRFYALWWFL